MKECDLPAHVWAVTEAVAEHGWGTSGWGLTQPLAPLRAWAPVCKKDQRRPFLVSFFLSLVILFHKVFFLSWSEGEILSLIDLPVELSWAVPASIPQGWYGLGTNTDTWVCFCPQHALPVHSAHGNVWLQKRHCHEVFQTPEWPLQGRAQVSLNWMTVVVTDVSWTIQN